MGAYLDHASATEPHPAARAALLTAIDDGWADPVRLYREGRRARMLLDAARQAVAAALGARPDEVSFTAGGEQAATLAVLGAAAARRRSGAGVLVSAVEHSAVLRAADAAADGAGTGTEAGGATRVPVDRLGRVAPAAFTPPPGTALACLQHANHEVGTVQPVAEVAEIVHAAGVPLHVDATTTVGRRPLDVAALGADLLSAGANGYGGPAGVGILVVRTGTRWRNPLPPDDREFGRVAGFPNVPGIVAAAAALEARAGEMAVEAERHAAFSARLREQLPALIDDVDLLGDPDPAGRLPGLVAFSCLYVDGETLVTGLDAAGIAVSSGSSCVADSVTPSHVLAAMGALTHGNVRITFGRSSRASDIDALLAVLPDVVRGARERAGAVKL
jgi:cysteine desulfurase